MVISMIFSDLSPKLQGHDIMQRQTRNQYASLPRGNAITAGPALSDFYKKLFRWLKTVIFCPFSYINFNIIGIEISA